MTAEGRAPFDASDGLLTVQEVAELFRVDRHTVLAWARNYAADNGRPSVPAIVLPGGQGWRISAKFVREHLDG